MFPGRAECLQFAIHPDSAGQCSMIITIRDIHPQQPPKVATSTALMVCMRFSAWSKTTKYGDSKTSPATSKLFIPVFA
jgi:hypothetical protein